MTFDFSIPCPAGQLPVSVKPGSSVVIVGANGGGKTRLAVHIENLMGIRAHRISAHRALTLNPTVAKISENAAIAGLRYGYSGESMHISNRNGSRWQSNMAVSLLNDFDYLIQALFADQANTSLATHAKVRKGDLSPAVATKFEQLDDIWQRLLPHRQLYFSGDDIQVSAPPSTTKYKSSDMSDGERAIFYLIGQTLAAAENSLLIFDEPELHIHRSIMSKLWDELEALRSDCAFVFITHDLEFAASREAQKFVISAYDPSPCWSIDNVPENTGFNEQITTLILGSRRPILFTEGDLSSLDLAIYRCCFPAWTVIPRGSCEEVIHSVVTMRRNSELTRVTCAGIVDADHYDTDDINYLNELGIAVLAVSEIDNLILLPAVSRTIAECEGYEGAALEIQLSALKTAIFNTLNSAKAIEDVVARYCRRRIDRMLKKIDLSNAKSVSDMTAEYAQKTSCVDIADVAARATDRINCAIRDDDLPALLANYDNKGLMALAATHLKRSKLPDFKSWLTRVLRNDKAPNLVLELRKVLPEIVAM
jgi:energy-coupling factor transporter ATP-binding protein EcfA2